MVELFLALVLSDLLEEGLLLQLLVVAAARLFVTVLAIEDKAAGCIPSLLRVRVVNHLSSSFHLFLFSKYLDYSNY